MKEENKMSGWETFLTAAGGLIAALGGFEFIKYLMNKNSNDRIMAAKAFQEERKTILEDYARIQKEVDRMQALIDKIKNDADMFKSAYPHYFITLIRNHIMLKNERMSLI